MNNSPTDNNNVNNTILPDARNKNQSLVEKFECPFNEGRIVLLASSLKMLENKSIENPVHCVSIQLAFLAV